MSNMAVEYIDLSNGYTRFDKLATRIEELFEQIYTMRKYKLDITYYEEEYEKLKKEFSLKDDSLKKLKWSHEDMKDDYEKNALAECNKKLEELINRFEERITPLYNIYLLFKDVDNGIENDDDLLEIINNSIKLIDGINEANTHNLKDINTLIERAYETIYNVLVYEEIYDNHDVLNYLNRKNLSTNRESLGKILRDDVSSLPISKEDIDEEFIKHINEGLGYDYLSSEFLGHIAKVKYDYKYREIDEKRENDIKSIGDKITFYNNYKENTDEKYKNSILNIKKLERKLTVLKLKSMALILVPFITTSAGLAVGAVKSMEIDEYATTTREIDLDTGELVGQPKTIYDEHPTNYVATITICEPWVGHSKNKYTRKAVTYEYIEPEGEELHITKEDIEGNVRKKYEYVEEKEQLSETDSTSKGAIYITETYQDKTKSRKSTKYVFPFTMSGLFLGFGIDIVIKLFHLMNFRRIARRIEVLEEKINDEKKDNELIKGKIEKLKQELVVLKEEKERVQRTYGITLDTELIEDKKTRFSK